MDSTTPMTKPLNDAELRRSDYPEFWEASNIRYGMPSFTIIPTATKVWLFSLRGEALYFTTRENLGDLLLELALKAREKIDKARREAEAKRKAQLELFEDLLDLDL